MFLKFPQYKSTVILALVTLAISGSAIGKNGESMSKLFEENPKDLEAQKVWSGDAQLGLVSSKGNSDNSSVTAGLTAIYNKRRLKHTLTGDVYFAENKDKKTAERFDLGYKFDYAINSKNYMFNFLTYSKDKFSNIDPRIADVVGYGRNLIENEKHILIGDIGLGGRQTKYADGSAKSNNVVGYLGVHYTGQLSDTTTLTEDLMIQTGKDNTFSSSVTALQVAMTEKLSLSLSYTVRNNTDVSGDAKKTDTVTSINLVSNF
jgi:putative salt-induced outer membrane protein